MNIDRNFSCAEKKILRRLLNYSPVNGEADSCEGRKLYGIYTNNEGKPVLHIYDEGIWIKNSDVFISYASIDSFKLGRERGKLDPDFIIKMKSGESIDLPCYGRDNIHDAYQFCQFFMNLLK